MSSNQKTKWGVGLDEDRPVWTGGGPRPSVQETDKQDEKVSGGNGTPGPTSVVD